eukprot:g50780.t1
MGSSVFLCALLGVPCCMGSIPMPKKGYTKEWFAHHAKNAGVYPVLAELIAQTLKEARVPDPTSVVDVGCGPGLLVEAWRVAGVADSYCLEGYAAARSTWPTDTAIQDKYYRLQDLTQEAALDAMPATDLVMSFEVGEHLPEEKSNHYVNILTRHRPRTIVFGAATVNQDRGRNPTHINENTFEYWLQKFKQHSYSPDMVATATLRHKLLFSPESQRHITNAWWYPKNAFVLTDVSDQKTYYCDVPQKCLVLTVVSDQRRIIVMCPKNAFVLTDVSDKETQAELDRKLAAHPKK